MQASLHRLRSSWIWLLLIFTVASLVDAAFFVGASVGPALGAALSSAAIGLSVWWIFPIAALMTVAGIGVMAWAAGQARLASAEAGHGRIPNMKHEPSSGG